jgi:hypothetical protein
MKSCDGPDFEAASRQPRSASAISQETTELTHSHGKTFCIGFNKAGTVFLPEALVTLGYPNLYRDGAEARRAVRRAMQRCAFFPAGDGCPVLAVPFPWRNRYGTWREPTSLEAT